MKSVEAPKDSPEYQAYLWARERVLKMKEMESSRPGGAHSPSDYWREELANLDYMLDATPAIIRKLRHHCFHITGTRVYDYRSNQDDKQRNFKARLQELVGIAGKQLLVPESPILGGFGFQIDGNLYNIDTLKFFEVLIGMDLAGALDAFRGNQERRLVWEIGVGWGGFAYQFKTLFPNVTYLMVDFPELFLFSAVYLKAAFPQSRMLFYGDVADSELFADWRKYDFIFIPNTFLDALKPDRLDLTINMVSFQEMTAEQVRAYVKRTSDLKCPLLYSMNRDRSPYNKQLSNVRSIIGEHYDIRELDVLGSDYTSGVTGTKRGEKPKDGLHYRHVVGRLPVVRERTNAPKVGIGMALYNNARYLEEALDSLLAQTYQDFGLVLVDDGSTDGTEEIVRRYSARDRRIVSYRHKKRQGQVGAWRRAFELVCENFPEAGYFAWASDHDRWHPEWLSTMVNVLETYPRVVLAYPLTREISAGGEPVGDTPFQFETLGKPDLQERFRYVCYNMRGAGNMFYGLMRTNVVRQAGVFRPIVLPDRLLMAEISLQGGVKQVPDVLWYRRRLARSTISRQRKTLFADGETPLHTYLPWWLVHSFCLARHYGMGRNPKVPVGRLEALRMAWFYLRSQRLAHRAHARAERKDRYREIPRSVRLRLQLPKRPVTRVRKRLRKFVKGLRLQKRLQKPRRLLQIRSLIAGLCSRILSRALGPTLRNAISLEIQGLEGRLGKKSDSQHDELGKRLSAQIEEARENLWAKLSRLEEKSHSRHHELVSNISKIPAVLSPAKFDEHARASDLLASIPIEVLARFYSEFNVARKMDYERHDIYLRYTSERINIRLNSCAKEPFTVEWIEKFIKPGDVFYDIGASVGPYTLIAAKFTEGKCKVFAFEPGFSTFMDLCWNVILNECEESIVPLPIALSCGAAFTTFSYSALSSGAAMHYLNESADSKESPYRQPILAFRLDDVVQMFKIPLPNHVKIDVDGDELRVLQGAVSTLRNSELRSLILEVGQEGDEMKQKICNFLEEHGFQVHSQHRRGKLRAPMYCVFTRR